MGNCYFMIRSRDECCCCVLKTVFPPVSPAIFPLYKQEREWESYQKPRCHPHKLYIIILLLCTCFLWCVLFSSCGGMTINEPWTLNDYLKVGTSKGLTFPGLIYWAWLRSSCWLQEPRFAHSACKHIKIWTNVLLVSSPGSTTVQLCDMLRS